MANSRNDPKMVRLWPNAHEALEKLVGYLAVEKGLSTITYTDAASIAILEAVERRDQAAREPAAEGAS